MGAARSEADRLLSARPPGLKSGLHMVRRTATAASVALSPCRPVALSHDRTVSCGAGTSVPADRRQRVSTDADRTHRTDQRVAVTVWYPQIRLSTPRSIAAVFRIRSSTAAIATRGTMLAPIRMGANE
jgi:hypothetical protein